MVWGSCVAPTAGDDGGSTPAPPTAPNTPQEQTSHQTQAKHHQSQKANFPVRRNRDESKKSKPRLTETLMQQAAHTKIKLIMHQARKERRDKKMSFFSSP